MLVKDIMTKEVILIPPSFTIQQAVDVMNKTGRHFLPVGKHDQILGVVTKSDIDTRAIATGLSLNSSVCNTNGVRYCFEEEDVVRAKLMMKKWKVKRLIVLNKNISIAGIVSLTDTLSKTNTHSLINSFRYNIFGATKEIKILSAYHARKLSEHHKRG